MLFIFSFFFLPFMKPPLHFPKSLQSKSRVEKYISSYMFRNWGRAKNPDSAFWSLGAPVGHGDSSWVPQYDIRLCPTFKRTLRLQTVFRSSKGANTVIFTLVINYCTVCLFFFPWASVMGLDSSRVFRTGPSGVWAPPVSSESSPSRPGPLQREAPPQQPAH